MKLIGNDKAVSEVLGTLLMMVLGVIIFSIVSVVLLSPSSVPAAQYVKLDCEIIDHNITITHQGGDALSLNIKITFYIGDDTHVFTIDELLDSYYSQDGFWNIGDQIIYNAGDFENLPVKIQIIDLENNFLLLDEVLQ